MKPLHARQPQLTRGTEVGPTSPGTGDPRASEYHHMHQGLRSKVMTSADRTGEGLLSHMGEFKG